MKQKWLFWLGLVLCLALPNGMVVLRRARMASAGTVYLELSPNSLSLQGSDVFLTYVLEAPPYGCNWPSPGWLTAEIDEQGKIVTWRPDELPPSPVPSPPAGVGVTKVRLPYEVKGGHLSVAPRVLKYRGGQDVHSSVVHYAILALFENDQLVVTGLADDKFQRL